MKRACALGFVLFTGCGRYGEFTLPPPGGAARAVVWRWQADPKPALSPGPPGAWNSADVLNPSVIDRAGVLYNLFSGFDGKTWHTGLAISRDGVAWQTRGRVLSPDPATWEGGYIAANGSAIDREGEILYFYQAGGSRPSIGLARSREGRDWSKEPAAVLTPGPRGSWDERGAADPYVIAAGGDLYLFYLGMDRARRQRLGVAVSRNGFVWQKLRSNPVLEPGGYGAFDENGVGEPAVWSAEGSYWMLYTGRDRGEARRLGMAQSPDGVRWTKLATVISGDQPWNAQVICDATVLANGSRARVWFGGGDAARPDENIHGQIGAGTLQAVAAGPSARN